MSSFCSATSAQRRASLRACSNPSLCSRTIEMSATSGLLELSVPLLLGQGGESPGRIIELRPVVPLEVEQGLESGHQFVVGGLRAEEGVVGLAHPAVVAPPHAFVAPGGSLHLRVLGPEPGHHFLLALL